ncbi:MAG: hypothetical protein V4754_19725 [Pseudomonadota bacterium]
MTTKAPPFEMTQWQKKQAAMLYHFASMGYLKGLQQRVNDLIAFVEPTLDLAKAQNRDARLVSAQWGTRNTSQNWSNNAWPFLADFQKGIAQSIAERAFEVYDTSGVNNCARGISEYSMEWTTHEEEDKFKAMFEELSLYALDMDSTLYRSGPDGRWTDFTFALTWAECKHLFPKLPKLQIRADVEGESGRVPVRTGVYVSQNDPHAALQFAWTGDKYGRLLNAKTFNKIGLDALKFVGRRELWFNDQRMYAFATSPKYLKLFKDDVTWNDLPSFDLAPSAVGREAFEARPCKWYYVEMVNGEFEDIDDSLLGVAGEPAEPLRSRAGHPCPKAGMWLSNYNGVKRNYQLGEIFTHLHEPPHGYTLWTCLEEDD